MSAFATPGEDAGAETVKTEIKTKTGDTIKTYSRITTVVKYAQEGSFFEVTGPDGRFFVASDDVSFFKAV